MTKSKTYRKLIARFRIISQNGIHQFLLPFSQFLVAYLVIQYRSEAIWGEVVAFLLVINLLNMLLGWGSKTYLLRAISAKPAALAQLWQKDLISRTTLLGGAVLGLLFFYWQNDILFWLILWLSSTFMYRSFNVIYLYTRRFSIPILVESISTLIMVGTLYTSQNNISSLLVIQLYAITALLRSVLYSFLFRQTVFKTHHWQLDCRTLIATFPYFIPGFIGFFQSQIDLYCVAYFLPKKTLGEYQVFVKALMLIFMISRIIVAPFIKNIYRLSDASIQKFHILVLRTGIVASFPFVVGIYIVMSQIYTINFSVIMYILGYFMVIPFFGYVIQTHFLLKYHQQYKIVWVFVTAAVVNLTLNIILIPSYQIIGAMLTTVVVQYLVWIGLSIFAMQIKKDVKQSD